jgi:YbbR domain-containing protein
VSESKPGGTGATIPPRRKASDSISSLGRVPARTGKLGAPINLPPRQPEPPPDRGARFRAHLREAFLGNLGLKFLSLVLALTVFLLVNTDRDQHRSARVGLSYRMPTDRVLVTPQLADVTVDVSGPYRRLRRLELDPIEIDLRDGRDAEIPITPNMIKVPSGVTVTSISPPSLRVAFEKRVTRDIVITPVIAGHAEHGYEVGDVTVDGSKVAQASGAEHDIASLTGLRTGEIRVDGKVATFAVTTQLVPPDGIQVQNADNISVTVEIKQKTESRSLGKLAVRVIGDGVDPIAVMTDPPAVEVILSGKVLAIDEAVKNGVVPTIKVTAADVAAHRQVAVQVGTLPGGVGPELNPSKIEVSPVVQPKP